MNLKDIDSSMIETYILNDGNKVLIEPADAFNFTWEVTSMKEDAM
jgi:hypothetical protein